MSILLKLQNTNHKSQTNSKPQITNNKQERLRKEGKKNLSFNLITALSIEARLICL
jgi:hypothetical protein